MSTEVAQRIVEQFTPSDAEAKVKEDGLRTKDTDEQKQWEMPATTVEMNHVPAMCIE